MVEQEAVNYLRETLSEELLQGNLLVQTFFGAESLDISISFLFSFSKESFTRERLLANAHYQRLFTGILSGHEDPPDV